MENKQILDQLIIGRVEPHIYAFTTNTVPHYLKVGDTQRPVWKRLDEWKKHYPDLIKHLNVRLLLIPIYSFGIFPFMNIWNPFSANIGSSRTK